MSIDYWQLNEVTIKNKYPLPQIDEILVNYKGKLLLKNWLEVHITSVGWEINKLQKWPFKWDMVIMSLEWYLSDWLIIQPHLWTKLIGYFKTT